MCATKSRQVLYTQLHASSNAASPVIFASFSPKELRSCDQTDARASFCDRIMCDHDFPLRVAGSDAGSNDSPASRDLELRHKRFES
jgi:hypothetical protein